MKAGTPSQVCTKFGNRASRSTAINAAIRAGVIRPEVLIPHENQAAKNEAAEGGGMEVGTRIRAAIRLRRETLRLDERTDAYRLVHAEGDGLPGLVIDRVGDNRYFLPQRLDEIAQRVREIGAEGPFTVRQFRDATGIGRNVAIDILEHFDGRGFTRRQGDARIVAGAWRDAG